MRSPTERKFTLNFESQISKLCKCARIVINIIYNSLMMSLASGTFFKEFQYIKSMQATFDCYEIIIIEKKLNGF